MEETEDATFQPDEIVVGREEVAYGFIIEVLTRGLYPNKFHVVREYLQNAYDAIMAWRLKTGDAGYGRIDIHIQNPSVFIYDDGTGMNLDKMNQYRYVGYSEKRTGEGVGFRGIGKLAGISVADKLIVTSSPAGIAERYKLVFDAQSMLSQILTLKMDGKNIPLTDLIRAHTSITTADEDPERHYTAVELYNIRADSASLKDLVSLREYLSFNAPVDFDPQFPYRETVDTWLREYVPDYDTVPVHLNGQPIYKPFVSDLKPPQQMFIWANDEQSQQEGGDSSDLIAFCWHCENKLKGQIADVAKRGLIYRVKNFAVGTNQLPRTTLWRYTPERAYYFFGEIHVCDTEIVPSSARDDFEQNNARQRLYKRGIEISKSLNKVAGESSDVRRARDFILRAESIVTEVEDQFKAGHIPNEVKFDKMFQVRQAVNEVEKRLFNASDDYLDRGNHVIQRGKELVRQLDLSKPGESNVGVYDIKQTLGLGTEAARVYDIIVSCLEDELGDQPELYERVVRRIHATLGDHLRAAS